VERAGGGEGGDDAVVAAGGADGGEDAVAGVEERPWHGGGVEERPWRELGRREAITVSRWLWESWRRRRRPETALRRNVCGLEWAKSLNRAEIF